MKDIFFETYNSLSEDVETSYAMLTIKAPAQPKPQHLKPLMDGGGPKKILSYKNYIDPHFM